MHIFGLPMCKILLWRVSHGIRRVRLGIIGYKRHGDRRNTPSPRENAKQSADMIVVDSVDNNSFRLQPALSTLEPICPTYTGLPAIDQRPYAGFLHSL